MSARELYTRHVADQVDPKDWDALTSRERAGWEYAAAQVSGPGLTDQEREILHAEWHDMPGNLLGRDDCGYEVCEFWDVAGWLAARGVSSVQADDAEHETLRRERDEAREALDAYLSDPPPPIGSDVIADAHVAEDAARASEREAWREVERLREELVEAESVQADDDLRAEWLEFTAALGFGDDKTEPAAMPRQIIDIIQQAFDEASEYREGPRICENCGEWLATVACEPCHGSGCGPGTATGAYEECEHCAGVGKAHPGCMGKSYAELAALAASPAPTSVTSVEPGCTCGGMAVCQQCQDRDAASPAPTEDREEPTDTRLAGRPTVIAWEEHERLSAAAVAREHLRMVHAQQDRDRAAVVRGVGSDVIERSWWTLDRRPLDVVDGRLVERQHTACAHGVPLVEPCDYCRAALASSTPEEGER